MERPASAAKELIENAMDAGAGEIRVDASRGGVTLLRVRDDGHGIAPEEMALALCRHATSKIASLEDLEGVMSMGFRGEALPSIASVTRFSLISRVQGGADAYEIHARDGQVSTPVPASHPVGTTVEIRDLFYNTPARRRFLRADRTEFRHLEDVVRRLALARPDIAFGFEHNGRRVFSVRSAAETVAEKDRLTRLLGLAFMRQARRVQFDAGGLQLTGWLAGPDFSRSESNIQHFFLNGRMIRDPLVRHAVNLAYEGSLPEGRFAGFVLNLGMQPQDVDVNVHPTKHEVRFAESRQVHDFIVSGISRALHQDSEPQPGAEVSIFVPEAVPPTPRRPPPTFQPSAPPPRQPPVYVRESGTDYAAPIVRPSPLPAGTQETPAEQHETARACLVLPGRFFLACATDVCLLVDKRLCARALFDWHLRQDESPLRSLPLLLPVSEAISENRSRPLEDSQALLERVGVSLRETAPGRVSLLELPWILAGVDHAGILARLLCWLNEVDAKRTAEALAKTLAGAYADIDTGLPELTELMRCMDNISGHQAWVEITEQKLNRLMADAG